MKIVIDIPESMYEGVMIDRVLDTTVIRILNEIKNGTVLPKGHGRILDEKDILNTENNDGGWYDLVDMPEYIAGVKAIIEADKAESEDKYYKRRANETDN